MGWFRQWIKNFVPRIFKKCVQWGLQLLLQLRKLLHEQCKIVTREFWNMLHRNCLLNHVIEGKIRGMRRRSRRSKQLLDDFKGKRRYWNLVVWKRKHSVAISGDLALEKPMVLSQDWIRKEWIIEVWFDVMGVIR
jgi:hypothetical protein